MNQNSKIAVIIPAAGKSVRFGMDKPKQYIALGEQTILEHAVNIILNLPYVASIVIAVDPDDQFIHAQ
jgi:2-C-methyl-D-erythritol 4-phosphate cytidylyltransferase